MLFKVGVNLTGVREPIWYALGVFEAVYKAHGAKLVVTSLTDGVHPDVKNIHGNGFAADLRTNTLHPDELTAILSEAKVILFELGFDIVLEKDHIHVEFDPKPGRGTWQMEHA